MLTCRRRGEWLLVALLAALPGVRAAGQQTVVIGGDSARIARVVAAVAATGFANVVVAGHDSGAADPVYVLAATARGDSGILLAVLDVADSAAQPLVLDRAGTPADFGLRGATITPFLGRNDLFDIEIVREPFQLEMSRRYATHYIVRRLGPGLAGVCAFAGSSTSSYSKGIGGTSTTRTVTVRPVRGAPSDFTVTARENVVVNGTAQSPASAPTVVRYRIAPGVAGRCTTVPLKGP